MTKIFYTERDLQDLHRRGERQLIIDGNVVLTDLAYEIAARLGVVVVRKQTAPCAIHDAPQAALDIRHELLQINNELFVAGLVTSTGGNISVRVPGRPNELWITPGSVYKGALQAEMMVRIDLEGSQLDTDSYPASSECFVHCEVLKRRPELNAVVHTHAAMATVMALAELSFVPISIESAYIGEIARVDFIKPGTKELGLQVAQAMDGSLAVLMQNHGLVVAGRSLRSAADMTHVIEQTAKKIITCHMLGKTPPVLAPETAEEYRKAGELKA
jgi:ribulose-5-phosphate 4-epimerase/fuculose-1-phosphate aldolase